MLKVIIFIFIFKHIIYNCYVNLQPSQWLGLDSYLKALNEISDEMSKKTDLDITAKF